MNPSEVPLYEIKANLFRALAHPVRIRVLELLAAAQDTRPDDDGAGSVVALTAAAPAAPVPTAEASVGDLLADLAISPSLLSGHLAVLKRHGVVTSRRTGSQVYYRMSHPAVVDLLTSARRFLLDSLTTDSSRLALAVALPPLS